MKKRIYFIIMLSLFILLLCSCYNYKKRIIPDSDFEYTEYYSSMDAFNPDLCYRAVTYTDFEHIIKSHGFNIKNYDESFFENNGLILYMISEGSSGYEHYLSFKNNGEYIDFYYQRVVDEKAGYTCDMAYYLVCIEIDLEILTNIKGLKYANSDNVIMFDDIFVTKLPKEMPDDFWIYIYDYKNGCGLDSRNNKRWYNNKEISESVLTKEELQDIYEIFYRCDIDRYQGHIYLGDEKDNSWISIWFNNINVNIHGYQNITNDWFDGVNIYYAFEEICAKYVYPKNI